MSNPASASTKARRTRDPEAHRLAIVEAARACFAENGYAKTTIRAIARSAGVTHGLVMRHFSTKEQLFIAAVPGPRDLDSVIRGDIATLPQRVAASFVERMENADGQDPLITLIRSAASNEKAATALYSAMHEQSAAAYRSVLGGGDTDARIDLLAAQLIGVAFNRYIIGVGPLARMSVDQLTTHLAHRLRHLLLE